MLLSGAVHRQRVPAAARDSCSLHYGVTKAMKEILLGLMPILLWHMRFEAVIRLIICNQKNWRNPRGFVFLNKGFVFRFKSLSASLAMHEIEATSRVRKFLLTLPSLAQQLRSSGAFPANTKGAVSICGQRAGDGSPGCSCAEVDPVRVVGRFGTPGVKQ